LKDIRVLAVVGAHIGDCEVMSGGLAARAVEEGWDVHFIHMTGGEKGHPNLPENEYFAQKKKEAEEFGKDIGVSIHIMPYRDGELKETEDVKTKMGQLFREIRPSVLLTHWSGSFHKDHRATYAIVGDAIFLAANPWTSVKGEPCRSKLLFAENWEDHEDFQPEIYVDISSVLDKWVTAMQKMAMARGETGFNYIDYYVSLARIRGLEVGVGYSEALMRPWEARRILLPQLDKLL